MMHRGAPQPLIRSKKTLCTALWCPALLVGCLGTEVQEKRFPDGTLQARSRVRTTPEGDAIPHGRYTEWYENGGLAKEGRFVKGNPHGTWSTWYPDGKRKSEKNYDHGRRHGQARFWYGHGQLKRQVHFKDGAKHGRETEWYENGDKKWEAEYVRGAIQWFDSWGAGGQLIKSFSAERGYLDAVQRKLIKPDK